MLTFFVKDQALDLGKDFSISFNFYSPIFNDLGSFSYPIKLPYTPRNASILHFKDRVENTTDPYETFPCKILIDGTLITGLLKCTISNQGSFEGSVYAIDGDFFYDIQNKALQNYDFGEKSFPDIDTAFAWMNSCYSYDYPDRPCAFPIIEDPGYIDPPDPTAGPPTFNAGVSRSSLFVPMLYLKYILKKLCEGLGYKLESSFFDSHSDFNRLVLFNCVSATENSVISNYFTYNYDHLFFNYHLPFIALKDFITGIENNWNLKFFVNSTKQTIRILSLKSILEDSRFIEFSDKILSKSVEPEEKIPGFHLKMNLDDNDSYFDGMNQLNSLILDNLKGSVEKFSELPKWPAVNPLEIRYVEETSHFYQMTYQSWVQLPDDLHLFNEYLYRDAQKSIDTCFSTLFQIDGMCAVMNPMLQWNKITPRTFFIYRNPVYPTQIWGKYSTDNFSLWYKGPTGIFEKQFKSWLDWRVKTKKVKTTKQMSWTDIVNIDFASKYMMHGVKSLLGSVQVTVKTDSISPCLIEHYPCY